MAKRPSTTILTRAPYSRKPILRVCYHCGSTYDAVGKGNKGACSDECRFWSKIDRRADAACWPWTGSIVGGYGTFRFDGKTRKAHRVAFFLAHGRWPLNDGLHSCDNPRCCNVAHIWDGTHQDNMADMKAKGRARSVRGSQNKNAKLTEDDVRAILRDPRPRLEVMQTYGIGSSALHAIYRGQTWKHVEADHGC